MFDVAGFVLAGGKSSRMGVDKALLELDGRTLLERALHLAKTVSDEVRIVGPLEKFPTYEGVVEDKYAARGPLAGIHAALEASKSTLNLMLAVDLPFLEPAFLRFLVECAGESRAVVTVPKVAGGYQPLCAVYTHEFAEIAESALKQAHNKIDALFKQTRVREINESELAKFAFNPAMFENLNTPEDWGRISRGAPLK